MSSGSGCPSIPSFAYTGIGPLVVAQIGHIAGKFMIIYNNIIILHGSLQSEKCSEKKHVQIFSPFTISNITRLRFIKKAQQTEKDKYFTNLYTF